MNPRRSLQWKIALVTDGLRGVGPAIVERLANDGATVVFIHTAPTAAAQVLVSRIQSSGGTAIAIEAHCAAMLACEQIIATAIERFGHIDILISNGDRIETDAKTSDALPFADLFRSDRLAPSMFVDAVIAHMPIGGRIIATACAAAADVNISLARALSARGITVNVIQPAMSHAEMGAQRDSSAGTLEVVRPGS